MDLLILGGTRFMGRALVSYALARGHRVTLFHRGQTGADVFPDCEHVLGDRDGGLAPLAGRRFDAVVDTSGYVPRVVGDSVRMLREAAPRYVFISSISVYVEPVAAGADESAAVAQLVDPAAEAITGETYGGLKALCEDVVRDAYGERALIVRPGLIVGPHDPTDRFTWWPERVAGGGRVIAPGDPEQGLQFIDGRDLGEWIVRALEAGKHGTFHATGPAQPLSMREFLATTREALASNAEFVWMDEAFLTAQGVTAWQDLPAWVNAAESGLAALDVSRAVAAGLTFRPLADTVRDTLAWSRARGVAPPLQNALGATARPGLTSEREAEVFAAWERR